VKPENFLIGNTDKTANKIFMNIKDGYKEIYKAIKPLDSQLEKIGAPEIRK